MFVIFGTELIMNRRTQRANIKYEKALFYDLFLPTLQSFDSLNDIHRDTFQPNKEIVIMEM